jgi:hypothetical protein
LPIPLKLGPQQAAHPPAICSRALDRLDILVDKAFLVELTERMPDRKAKELA